MNDPIFKTIPRVDNFTIPFKLTENLLLEWLLGLSKQSALEACSSILQLLQALNKEELAAKTRFSFLKISHEYLKQYINQLEGSCWEAALPLSAKEQDYAEAVVWNYLALGEGFFIAGQDLGSRTEEAFALYMACCSLGQAQLHAAAVYKKPSQFFWQLVYKIFAWAEKYKILDIAINDTDLKKTTLNSLFAQMLIFQRCNTHQFRPRDMRTVFNFLPKVCGNVSICKFSDIKFQTEILQVSYIHAVANSLGHLSEKKLLEKMNARQDLFIFDLSENISPFLANPTHLLKSPSLRYFSSATVVKNLQQIINKAEMWSGVLKSINHELFGRVIKTLEPRKKRKHERSQTNHARLGVIGFENIISFLYKVNNKNHLKINPLLANQLASYEKSTSHPNKTHLQSGTISGGFSAEIDFTPSSVSNNAMVNETAMDITNRPVSLKKLTIFDSSVYGYSVHWADDQNLKAKVGDLFAIITEDKKRLEIAIIRRIAMMADTGHKFGTEVLGFDSEAVIITHINNPNRGGWCIFIPGVPLLKQADSIVYTIGNFQVGDRVYIYRQNEKITATLSGELNATPAIAHAELNYL